MYGYASIDVATGFSQNNLGVWANLPPGIMLNMTFGEMMRLGHDPWGWLTDKIDPDDDDVKHHFEKKLGRGGQVLDRLGGMGRKLVKGLVEIGGSADKGLQKLASENGPSEIGEGLGQLGDKWKQGAGIIVNNPGQAASDLGSTLGAVAEVTWDSLRGANGRAAQEAAIEEIGALLVGTLIPLGQWNRWSIAQKARALEIAGESLKDAEKLAAMSPAEIDNLYGEIVDDMRKAARGNAADEAADIVRGRKNSAGDAWCMADEIPGVVPKSARVPIDRLREFQDLGFERSFWGKKMAEALERYNNAAPWEFEARQHWYSEYQEALDAYQKVYAKEQGMLLHPDAPGDNVAPITMD